MFETLTRYALCRIYVQQNYITEIQFEVQLMTNNCKFIFLQHNS